MQAKHKLRGKTINRRLNRHYLGILEALKNKLGQSAANMDEWELLLYCAQWVRDRLDHDMHWVPLPTVISKWTKKEIAVLGTMSDPETADYLGRPVRYVEIMRKKLAIPKFVDPIEG
jgi:hypothetical protein